MARGPFKILLTVMIFLLALPSLVIAGEPVAIIVHRDNPLSALSETDIKKIYTNHMLNWPGGTPITVYDLLVANPLRAAFSDRILGKPPARVAEEWAHLKITNQAKNPPHTMKSESLIIRKVSAEKGAIGYVSLNAAKNSQDVKIVLTVTGAPEQDYLP